MRGLKYLCRRGLNVPRIIVPLILAVAMVAVVIIFHEEMNTEDYLICKMSLSFVSLIGIMMISIFLWADVSGNRMMRSSPISKELHTFSLPVFSSLLNMGSILLTVFPYIIFVLVTGLPVIHISDTLVAAAPVLAWCTFSVAIAVQMRWGMLILIYSYIPLMLCFFFFGDERWAGGFGLPLWAAVLIFLGGWVLATVISFIVCKLHYNKCDFKAMQQTTPM